jgi:hypothetical protein
LAESHTVFRTRFVDEVTDAIEMNEPEIPPSIDTTPPLNASAACTPSEWMPHATPPPTPDAGIAGRKPPCAARWREDEDAVIVQHYGQLPVAQIRERFLPQRSIAGICARAERLGVTGAPRNGWTKQELLRLKEFYGRVPVAELIRSHLPNRSKAAIHTRAYALRLTSKASAPWTSSELEVLATHYRAISVPELQKRHLPHRTRAAIATQARMMGISQPASVSWTGDEDRMLREHYPSMAIPAIRARYLPHRSNEAVRGRADVLGLRKFPRIGPWTEEQLALLRSEFPKPGGVLRLCEHFRCSGNTIRNKARELGLSSPRSRQWSDSELATLRGIYPTPEEPSDSIAERTRAALFAAEADAMTEYVE